MNILGIDYGKKRLGLAWVQEGLDVVLPFGVVENSEQQTAKNELVKIVAEEKISKIVVGLPLGLDGNENDNTKGVRKFIEELKSFVRVPVETVDERFSSRAADRMEGSGVSRDERAAMVILQTYLGT